MMRAAAPALALALLAAAPARAADEPQLGFPLACTPNQDCFISTLIDHDPGPGAQDYACGGYTYDKHDGVDFAIRDEAAMRQGVDVVAAAPGRVMAVRDGEPDISVKERGVEALGGKDCGNRVAVSLGNGWLTDYCHLKAGSLRVKPGDEVQAGQVLAQVGMSGFTEYPHLHFSVRHGKQVVDPFQGETGESCQAPKQPLWKADLRPVLAYAPGVIYNAGFAAGPPDPKQVRAGAYRADRLGRTSPALVLWYELFAVNAGDRLQARVTAPDGSLFAENDRVLDKRQARYFQFVGRKLSAAAWPAGTYQAEITLTPADPSRPPHVKKLSVTVE